MLSKTDKMNKIVILGTLYIVIVRNPEKDDCLIVKIAEFNSEREPSISYHNYTG